MMDLSLYHPVNIGSLKLAGNIFLAPVAAYSNATYRSICAKMGADFAYTELVSSEALIRSSTKSHELLRKGKYEKKYAIQLFGGNPEHMAEACKIVLSEYNCDCIDINIGCPMPKITKTCAGSFLMKDPTLLFDVVHAVVKASESFTVPTSTKIRAGWDAQNLNWAECARACVEAGAKAITLHPRTSTQKYTGKANWELISELVSLYGNYVSVFGSGDLFSPEDAVKMLKETKCDAVMFARGAMGNPFIFQQTKDLLLKGTYEKEISAERRLDLSLEELVEMLEYNNEKDACLKMRKNFAAATKGIVNASVLRSKLVRCSSLKEYKETIEEFLQTL